MRRSRVFLVGAVAFFAAGLAWGYALLGSKWATDRPVIDLQLGASGALIDGSSSWNVVAERALAIWNQKVARVQFRVVRNSSAPIADANGRNNVFFSGTFYGMGFGNAVAITSEWDDAAGRRIEGDTVFNANLAWNSYRGNLRRAAGGGTLYDLQRVALHEFGHLLGLDHPDQRGQSVSALMNSRVSNLDRLTSDDVAGAQALYGARAPVRAKFVRPSAARIETRATRYGFKGRANPAVATRVYVTSSRLAKKYFPVVGLKNWRRTLALRRGTNVIRLYVDTPEGRRVLVARRTVVRRR